MKVIQELKKKKKEKNIPFTLNYQHLLGFKNRHTSKEKTHLLLGNQLEMALHLPQRT